MAASWKKRCEARAEPARAVRAQAWPAWRTVELAFRLKINGLPPAWHAGSHVAGISSRHQ
jgi:hypothetical protein